MVPTLSLVFIVVTVVVCLAVPLGGILWISTRRTASGQRRWPHVWRAFGAGALAFVLAQLLTRIPLMTFVVPLLPDPVSGFLLSAPVASYTAGLFEETGRLLVMLWLLRAFHRWIDGVSFGLGHGGIEAVLLVGLTNVNNLAIALLINTGQWDAIAASLPAETAAQVHTAMVDTSPWLFLAGGVERLSAISLHIACSLLVLGGIVAGRRLAAWLAAVLVHGTFNLVAVGMLGLGAPVAAVEALLLALAAGLWVAIIRSRPRFPAGTSSEVAPAPGVV